LKKLIALVILLALWQNWGTVERAFSKPPVLTDQGEVILYATSWCGYCRMTRTFLADNGIEYTEYDIEASAEGKRQYDALGVRGIPVLRIRGTLVEGFDPNEILAALH
jgi:mycoredoxin